jgi:TetR/AcrR family transcriptional regulator, transcriptional repressor for nem operon
MPRASKEQAESNRRLITDNSARLLRERGIHGLSVADLMSSAGLTHGGFYGHFDSKDQLAAQACAHAFDHSVERWRKRIAGEATTAAGFKAIVEGYLSTRNRDNPGASCPTPALVGDVAREPQAAPVRTAYRAGVEQLLDVLDSVQDDAGTEQSRRRTLAEFAMMVGAMALARATRGDPISEAFLVSAREMLTAAPHSAGSAPTRRRRR